MAQVRGVLFDVEGTLVDSNDAHVRAWVEAFEKHDYHVSFDKVRSYLGMGVDNFIKAVTGQQDDLMMLKLSKQYSEIFRTKYLPHITAFAGAKPLIERMHQHGLKLIAASSSPKIDIEALLNILGIAKMIDGFTSADDVDNSKPAPDILKVALDKSKLLPNEAIVIGDTPYEIEAATRLGLGCIAFRCGGWQDRELEGALEIYDGPGYLLAQYDKSVFVQGYAAHR